MAGRQIKLGDLLLQAGLIDEMQLKSALGYQRRWGGKLGKCLVDQGFLEEETFLRFLSQQFKMRAVDLTRSRIAPQTFAMVPEQMARKYEVVPVVVKETPGKKTLVLAMSDPSDLQSADEIQFLTNCKIEPVLATDSAIAKVLSHYGDYSPEMVSGSQWGVTPAELRRQDSERTKVKEPKPAEPQVVGEGQFDLRDEALESEGVGIRPEDDEVEIVRDEITMIKAGMETPPPRPQAPARPAAPPLGARVPPPARPAPPSPPERPSASTGPIMARVPPPSRPAPPAPPPRPPASSPPLGARVPPPSRPAQPAPPPRPPVTPSLGARVPPPARPAPASPPPAPPALEKPPSLEAEPEFEIEHGAPSAPLSSEPEFASREGIDLELPEDDGSQMELAGAHEFVPVLDEENASKGGVGIEHARTGLDRSLFERREVASADFSQGQFLSDESVTEVPPVADDFFHAPAPKAAPVAPEPEPTPPPPEAAPPSLDLPDLDLPPLAAAPPIGARVLSPSRPAPPAPPPPMAPPPLEPEPAAEAAAPPFEAPVTSAATSEPPSLIPPPLDLAEPTDELGPPPILEPHAPPVPEFDLPPAAMDYEFKPEAGLPFEGPPPKPAFEGDLAERPDTPDFSALAEKPLPKTELTEDEMFFNVEREKPAAPEIATGEMEKIPAAPEESERLEQARRKLAELEATGADFLDANALKARLQQIEELRSEISTREYQFDELLGLMMKKEMGELTSELFMKELTLLKRQVEASRKKKTK